MRLLAEAFISEIPVEHDQEARRIDISIPASPLVLQLWKYNHMFRAIVNMEVFGECVCVRDESGKADTAWFSPRHFIPQ